MSFSFQNKSDQYDQLKNTSKSLYDCAGPVFKTRECKHLDSPVFGLCGVVEIMSNMSALYVHSRWIIYLVSKLYDEYQTV